MSATAVSTGGTVPRRSQSRSRYTTVHIGYMDAEVTCCPHCHGDPEDCTSAALADADLARAVLLLRQRQRDGFTVFDREWEEVERLCREAVPAR